MAELTPFEKLQPCLLDRLTDDEPANTEESRNQRVISLQRYRRGVLRDIEWLLNASAHVPQEGHHSQLQEFAEANWSVLNYGARQLCGLLTPNMEELQAELAQAIQFFEPRILRHTLVVQASQVRNIVAFEIRGELWAHPIPEQLFIKTKIDLETGHCLAGDTNDG